MSLLRRASSQSQGGIPLLNKMNFASLRLCEILSAKISLNLLEKKWPKCWYGDNTVQRSGT
jgi:hypothetical protein